MFQCRVLMLALVRMGEGPVQRRFKLGRKPRPGNALSGRKRGRGGVVAESRRLRADRSTERIPIGHTERLGDQFEALTDGDLETLCGESRTQRVSHGLGVAKIAHVFTLCLSET